MDQVAFFLSGAALVTSLLPKVLPAIDWIIRCEACEKLRHHVAAIIGG